MRFGNIGGYLLVGVLAAPGLTMAAVSKPCPAPEPTRESYTRNFKEEASTLLNGIQAEADQAKSDADTLRSMALSPTVDWQAHAEQWREITKDVDDIGTKLCRLETIRSAVLPWEKTAIDKTNVFAREMADNANQAIKFLNDNHNKLWAPEYRQLTANLYDESGQLSGTINRYERLAKLRAEESQIRTELRTPGAAL